LGQAAVNTALAIRLRHALRQGRFSGRSVVVGLSQPDLELHALELPDAPDAAGSGSGPGKENPSAPGQAAAKQIESAARWEIERLSRFAEGSTQTAHWRLPRGKGNRSAPGRTTAIGVAAPRNTVQKVWDLCREAGAECRRIDASACALSRGAAALRPPLPDEVWGVLDLGARAARLILCVDDVPVVSRALEAGGGQWTQMIADSLRVGMNSAELHKCDHGLHLQAGPLHARNAPGESGRPPQVNDSSEAHGPLSELGVMILTALRPNLERLASEVERSYEYVLQCYPGRTAGDLILAGGGANLRNLDAYLHNRLGIPVAAAQAYLGHPECRLRVASPDCLREPLGIHLSAIGLALDPEFAA